MVSVSFKSNDLLKVSFGCDNAKKKQKQMILKIEENLEKKC